MKITKGELTEKRLENEGWTHVHYALYHGYGFAGGIGKMHSRKGYEFCRVYHGRCKNIRINGGYLICCQVTSVYKRPIAG